MNSSQVVIGRNYGKETGQAIYPTKVPSVQLAMF